MSGLPFSLALLFAVPTSKHAFLAAARAETPSDYLRGMLVRRTAEQAWAEADGYGAVAAAATRLAGQAEALGGQVIHGATCADLLRATGGCDVVILCGHWRGDPIAQVDLKGASDAILGALAEAPGAEGAVLRSATTDLPAISPGEDGDKAWRRELVRRLNRLIIADEFDAALGLTDDCEREAIGAALARTVIDEALGPLIAPGNRLELADGLFSEAEVEEAVAADFRGELDLSLCQSVYLARFLGHCRAEQWPRPLFHHGINLLAPITRFDVLGDVLALCAETGMPFHVARATLERALIDAFRQNDEQRKGTIWAWLRSWMTTSRATSC